MSRTALAAGGRGGTLRPPAHVHPAILDDRPVPTPIDDAVANMRVLEAIVRSGRNQGWEEFA